MPAILGIEKTLEVFDDLGVLAVSGVKIAKAFKTGIGLGAILRSLDELLALAKSGQELLKDVPGALPELLDLDSSEAERIGKASYALVKKVTDAVRE